MNELEAMRLRTRIAREEADYLKRLGASEVLNRADFSSPGKPLGKERWAGAVDVVGSHTLANICATTKYRGVVTACGLAGGMEVKAIAEHHLREIETKIEALRAMQATLSQLVEACAGDHRPDCPILADLAHDDGPAKAPAPGHCAAKTG